MSLESWGGNLPAGKPVAVASAGNRVDCFAIAAGGPMLHWSARDGVPVPAQMMPGGLNLPVSIPCATVLGDGSMHVFAIAPGGPLAYWRSPDGDNWPSLAQLIPSNLPAGWNGLACASPAPDRVDVFGIMAGNPFHGGTMAHFAFNSAGTLLYVEPVAGSDNQLGVSLLGACSPAPGRTDVFAIGPDGFIWHWTLGTTLGSWNGFERIGPFNMPIGPGSGIAAVASNGHIELFAQYGGGLCQWSGSTFAGNLPGTGPQAYNLPNGTPSAVFVTPDRLEVFAVGPGPLLRWRRDHGGAWQGPTSLDGHPAAGGVGLAVGASRMDAFAIHAGGSNCLLHWPAGTGGALQDAQDGIDQHWQNWAANQTVLPIGHCVPTSYEELVAIVRDAARAGKKVRAVGSSWSFSDVALTSDFLVETNRVNRVLNHVVPAALNTGSKTKNLVHVEAGMRLRDLMTVLDAMKLAPLTMGGAAGQTIAGVLSTSVHGCDFDRGPVCEMVRAVHLIGPSGEEHWIEAKAGITDPAALQAALGPQVQLHYDDDWFNAAAVTVGTLGIVYAVVLEVKPQHDIVQVTQISNWKDVRAQLATGSVFIDNGFVAGGVSAGSIIAQQKVSSAEGAFPLRGFQVAIDPTGPRGNHTCYVTTRAEAPATSPAPADPLMTPIISLFWDETALLQTAIAGAMASVVSAFIVAQPLLDAALLSNPITAPMVPILAGATSTITMLAGAIGPLLDALVAWLREKEGRVSDFLGFILNPYPDAVASLTATLHKAMLQPGAARHWAHTIMAPSDEINKLARGLAIEIAYDASSPAYLNGIDDLLNVLEQAQSEGLVLGGWFSLRFCGPAHAFLSPQQTSRTCMVEFTGVRALNSTAPILDRLEASAKKFGAIRHWAMFRNLAADEVERAYPNLDRWRRVRWALTKNGTKTTFDNPFAVRCGLTAPPSSPADAASVHSAVWPSADGRLELFAVGKSGLDHIWQTSTTVGGPWSGWFGHGGSVKGSPALCRGGDKSDLMVLGTDDALWHIWQTSANGGWSGWFRHGGSFSGSPALGQHVGGALEVFIVGRDGTLSNKRQSAPNTGWSDWTSLGGTCVGTPAVGRSGNQDLLEVMVIGTDGGLQHRWQTAGGWSSWFNHGGHFAGAPALARRGTDGALEVMAIGTDGHLYHKWQSSPGSGWSSWFDHGGSVLGAPSLALSGSSLEVMAVGTDGALWHKWQTAPGGGWSSWFSHGGAYVGSPFLARRGDGALEVFVLGKDGNLWHKWQGAPNGGWSAWLSHGPLP
jgi:FAD binding domain/D-arabinono-1,4-lactone oxidase